MFLFNAIHFCNKIGLSALLEIIVILAPLEIIVNFLL